MGIFHKIKAFFYRYALKKQLSQSNLDRTMMNLSEAKTIGILFNATKQENTVVVTQYANTLQQQGKKVYILGFQNSKSKEGVGEHFFDKNDVNWYGVPTGAKITKYQNIKKDILISAFIGDCLPLEYLTATSTAKFRVGAFSKAKTNCFELMINVKDQINLKYLLQQITHFLNVINKNA